MRLWKLCVLPAALALGVHCNLHAQDTIDKKQDTTIVHNRTAGTYTVQMVNTRDLPLLPYNIDQIVEDNRDQEKVIYKSLSPYVRLKIMPANEIKKAGYTPVKALEYVTE